MDVQRKYRKAVDEFVKKAMDNYADKIDSIILFGSVARGEAKRNSDVDILVITNGDSFEMQRLISGIVVEILLETGIYVSVKVLSKEEYELLRDIDSLFYRNLSEEGIVIG